MKILFSILSWSCFNCMYIQRIDIQYTVSDIRSLVKCINSMVSYYSSLNMKVISLYMVFAPPLIKLGEGGRWKRGSGGHLIRKICQNFLVTTFLLSFVAGLTSMTGVKKKWRSNIYYYITTLSLFNFFRDNQHSEKWSVSLRISLQNVNASVASCR